MALIGSSLISLCAQRGLMAEIECVLSAKKASKLILCVSYHVLLLGFHIKHSLVNISISCSLFVFIHVIA